jgi:hypothetical protein
MRERYLMEWLMEWGLFKMEPWSTLENGGVTSGMARDNKILSKGGIIIRENLLMISIVVKVF